MRLRSYAVSLIIVLATVGLPLVSAPPGLAATAGVSMCSSHALSLRLGPGDGYTGGVYYPIRFKNTGTKTCYMYGYPGVSARAEGHQVGIFAGRLTQGQPKTVYLKPGASAKAVLQIVDVENFSRQECKQTAAQRLRVTIPPVDTSSDYITHRFLACSRRWYHHQPVYFMYVGRVAA